MCLFTKKNSLTMNMLSRKSGNNIFNGKVCLSDDLSVEKHLHSDTLHVVGNVKVSGDIISDSVTYSNESIPIGSIFPLVNSSDVVKKGNFLKANGNDVSRDEYKELFDVIGTEFGKGDGTNSFNLPEIDAISSRKKVVNDDIFLYSSALDDVIH